MKESKKQVKSQNINEDFKPTIFKIKNLHIIINENHHTKGEDPSMEETTDITPLGNGVTVLNCIEKYLKHKLNGHKFNPDNLFFTEMNNGDLVAEYSAMSSMQIRMWNFAEPTQKEWEDYNNDKITLRSFIYQMSIVKEVAVTKEDFEKEGISEY